MPRQWSRNYSRLNSAAMPRGNSRRYGITPRSPKATCSLNAPIHYSKPNKNMTSFLAEIIGTALLILLGDGVVANVVLKGTKGNNSGWIVITFGWAMAVFVGVFVKLGRASCRERV